MECHESPKQWALKKRQRKYAAPKELRKANANGHSVKKIASEPYYKKNCGLFEFYKTVTKPKENIHDCNNNNSNNNNFFGPTDFEKNLDLHMVNGRSYSLNQKNNWQKINALITNSNADKTYIIPAKERNFNEYNSIYLKYYDLEGMEANMNYIISKRLKWNAMQGLDFLNNMDDNINDYNYYLKDSHYNAMKYKLEKERNRYKKSGRRIQRLWPQNIPKKYKRLSFKKITCSSMQRRCKLQNACVLYENYANCFWTPMHYDNDNDFLQIDLGKNYKIYAVSTMGYHRKDYYCKRSKESVYIDEYVKKYKVWIKKDDYMEYDNNKNKNKTKIKKRKSLSILQLDENWTDLGIYNGNKDSITEIANQISFSNSNNNNKCVICRYIRFYPLSAAKNGFCGRKSMQVGVYGMELIDSNQNIKKEDKNLFKSVYDLGNEQNIPSVTIVIKQNPNQNVINRHCWAIRRHSGVFSCSCYMCKCSKYQSRRHRKRAINLFKKNVNKLNSVKDYENFHDVYLENYKQFE